MQHNQAPKVDVHALQRSSDRQPLIAVVETMSEEIRRLGEDNAQLRAAVAMYRDVLERYTGKPAPPA